MGRLERCLAVGHVRSLFRAGAVGGLPDRELLGRYTSRGHGAEASFSALVERHGPMVHRVCGAVLRDPHDAHDAFQATFLVLVRRADAVSVGDSLGPWLHGVALRTARAARSAAARRRRHEHRAAERVRAPTSVLPWDDLAEILHDQVGRLPAPYRAAVVACLIQGRTAEQAAGQLGCPVGTVQSRLARGRERLRSRLVRRGVAPAAAATLGAAGGASAAVPRGSIEAATRLAFGSTSATVAGLAQREVSSMLMLKVKVIAAALVLAGGAAAGARVFARPGDGPPAAVAAVTTKAAGGWNGGDIRELRSLDQPGRADCVAFSPDGSLLAVGCSNEETRIGPASVALWETATWTKRAVLHPGNYRVYGIKFTPKGDALIVSGLDGSQLVLCDLATEKCREIYRVEEGYSLQPTPTFSPDGRYMLSAGPNAGVMIWDVATWKPLQPTLPGTRNRQMRLAIDPSLPWRDMRGRAYTVDADGIVMEVMAIMGVPLGYVGKPGTCYNGPPTYGAIRVRGIARPWIATQIAVSPDGKTTALCVEEEDQKGRIDLYDVLEGQRWRRRSTIGLDEMANSVYSLSFTPDGKALVAGTANRVVKLWDVATGRPLPSLTGHQDSSIADVAYSPDGKLMATAGPQDQTVRIWSSAGPR